MRAGAFFAIIAAALGLGGPGPAAAADLPRAPVGDVRPSYEGPARAGMLVIADDQPGVVVRAYWREPWHRRHYFPATGRRPKVGRDEHRPAAGTRPRAAQDYARYWWASSVFPSELPARRGYDSDPEPSLK